MTGVAPTPRAPAPPSTAAGAAGRAGRAVRFRVAAAPSLGAGPATAPAPTIVGLRVRVRRLKANRATPSRAARRPQAAGVGVGVAWPVAPVSKREAVTTDVGGRPGASPKPALQHAGRARPARTTSAFPSLWAPRVAAVRNAMSQGNVSLPQGPRPAETGPSITNGRSGSYGWVS